MLLLLGLPLRLIKLLLVLLLLMKLPLILSLLLSSVKLMQMFFCVSPHVVVVANVVADIDVVGVVL